VAARDAEVLVVGAGPVGLALALDLQRRGRSVILLEARATRPLGSRAIGIHPPSLRYLQQLGVVEALLAQGTRVERGIARGAGGDLGHLDFGQLAPPYPFVLTVPQPVSEGVLRAALVGCAPDALHCGQGVVGVEQERASVAVVTADASGVRRTWRGGLLVACDGHRSDLRGLLGVGWRGGAYRDRFAMADLPDDDPRLAARDALVALSGAGVVEAFPLPGGLRRWVVRLPDGDALVEQLAPPALAAWVAAAAAERTGLRPGAELRGAASTFGVERYLATEMAVGRVLLAGDAAHVVSPIGGQGMNLGWLDAAAYAAVIDRSLDRPGAELERGLARVAAQRRDRARLALLRAHRNTLLGRPRSGLAARARDALLRGYLRPPWAHFARASFTMGGLA
jgi:2-polyprenyl-6-methoxyphenol hydroxylase-like FAD-dependent oxidoreductase